MTITTTDSSGTAVEPEDLDVRLVQRIATVLDRDPIDLPPLARTVDLDALSTLAAIEGTSVSFEYEGCSVHVGDGGDLTVTELDAESS
ncbi:HalOD1 output domain-containing protein [Halogeometricum limi]|uniref:Halobacterial output domain-containing protein n=1 Tax=Halogeometricum limi TaxID=555875 RepID=A0A1I6FZL6_9EURY|nr:HalOD1 output domain-containing protein [Halogeometricum limi]SFR35395.1 hypothetical protein SAMN04488124_0611 [Halogeometricum limi]